MDRACTSRVALSALVAATVLGTELPLRAQTIGPDQGRQDLEPAEQPSTIRIQRVSPAPALDDFVNGKERQIELRITGFRQREPGDGVPVSRDTSAYLSYDDANLYVVFVCRDDPAAIRGRLVPRENIGEDDQVSVYLDTFRDRHRAYVFTANPRGVQQDGIITEGAEEVDYRFDTLWYSKGRITADGFVVWMAIPFKSLRFPDAPVQTWGIALGRSIVRNNETSFWPYVTQRLEGFVQQMATLEGLERISPGHNVQAIPYTTLTRSHDRNGTTDSRTDVSRYGFDSKMVMRDAMTLDVAVNPDFSEVESNEPQVTANQRFEVFFPEKRPLFIENAGYFKTPVNLFYSRRIADPSAGARLTGKAGAWVIGALATNDRHPGAGNQIVGLPLDRRGAIGALRLEREFGEQSNVGVLVTSRDVGPTSNRVMSLDTRLKLSPNWVAGGQLMKSYDRDLSGHTTVGTGFTADVTHNGRHFTYSAGYTDLGPNFRPQLGFVPRVDIRQAEQFVSYFWRPDGGRVVSVGPSASALLNVDRRGRAQDWVANPSFVVNLAGQTQLKVSWSRSLERFEEIDFQKHSTSASFSTAWLDWLTLSAFFDRGLGVNYAPAPALAPFQANTEDATLSVTLRPAPRVQLDETYILSRVDGQPQSAAIRGATSQNVFVNRLMRSRANVQFTRALSVRTIVDYNELVSNRALTALESYKQVTGDVLVTWLLNPGTAVYVGYTNTHQTVRAYENVPLSSTVTSSLLDPNQSATSPGRQLFVKLSYLWRF